jgi:phytoene dehydrogenase-like protein
MTRYHSYDHVIVGGGIAGLYQAYVLLQEDPSCSVILLEASRRWGGRIHTFHEGATHADASAAPITMEFGAGRFQRSHRRLWRLLAAMGLTDRIVANRGSVGLDHRVQTTIQQIYRHVDAHPERVPALIQHSLLDYLRTTRPRVVPAADQAYLMDHFGYSAELHRMNAWDAVGLLRDMVGTETRPADFYSLRGGLSQLVDRLTAWLKEHGAHLVLGRTVLTVDQGGPSPHAFTVYVSHGTPHYRAAHVYLAVPKESLERFPLLRPLRPWLATVVTVPLCRMYAVFPLDPQTGKPWFAGMKKQAVAGPLRWFIPINETTGVAMVSYTDDQFAKHWHQEWQRSSMTSLKHRLRDALQEALDVPHVPLPRRLRIAYWPSGVGYWAPRHGPLAQQTTQAIAAHIRHPLGPDVPLRILGENYAWPHQQWIEGALETVETPR